MARTAKYVVAYGNELSLVVAEETYRQHTSRETRVLRSEFIFVHFEGKGDWMGFRDVFEVDGNRVRDREDRLQRLFLESSTNAFGRMATLAEESARFNIGMLKRTLLPTTVLQFLQPMHQSRFRFTRKAIVVQDGRTLWNIAFNERREPTFVRTPHGKNLPSAGSIWIEPETGRVWRTELTLKNFAPGNADASIAVTYRDDEALGMLVPAEMLEEYRVPGDADADQFRDGISIISGRATYDRYRRFQTGARVIIPD